MKKLAAVFCGITMMASAASVWGNIINVQLEPGPGIVNYGTVSQVAVGGQNFCAPTAAINSFVYLDTITGNTGALMGGAANWTAAAGLLAGAMKTNVTQAGTTVTDFVNGKVAYINQFAPNTFSFEGQTTLYVPPPAWPAWLQNIVPQGDFLAAMLLKGEDVEIGIWPQNPSEPYVIAHMLTLTGVNWNDANGNGIYDPGPGNPLETYVITVIDPANNPIVATTPYQVSLVGGFMQIQYGANPAPYDIKLAVAESVPEPSTYALFCCGLALLGYARRRSCRKEP